MKKLLVGLLVLSSVSAFAAEKRIECMSANKKVQVALVGTTDAFDAVETLTIIKGGVFGRDEQIQSPNCRVELRENGLGDWALINCEDGKLLVSQLLKNEGVDNGSLKIGARRIRLSCKSN